MKVVKYITECYSLWREREREGEREREIEIERGERERERGGGGKTKGGLTVLIDHLNEGSYHIVLFFR